MTYEIPDTAVHLMVRFDSVGDPIPPLFVAQLSRDIRELAERRLQKKPLNFGVVVDVIHPR